MMQQLTASDPDAGSMLSKWIPEFPEANLLSLH